MIALKALHSVGNWKYLWIKSGFMAMETEVLTIAFNFLPPQFFCMEYAVSANLLFASDCFLSVHVASIS